MKKKPTFLFLPSTSQRPRRNGLPQPHRMYLANGVELPPVTRFTATMKHEPVVVSACSMDDPPKPEAERRILDLVLEFDSVTVQHIKRKPTRRARKR